MTTTSKNTTAIRTPRIVDPNFLSVDQFCAQLKEKGFSLSHDYVVKCIKAQVVKHVPAPSLLPESAQSGKSIRYRIPVAEVARVAKVLSDQQA